MPSQSADPLPGASLQSVWSLPLLFGLIYFIQGIAEPSEGLITQPVRSMLKGEGYSTLSVALFDAVLTIPWFLKPFYAWISDKYPIFGYHRRSYLMLCSLVAIVTLGYVGTKALGSWNWNVLLALLTVATMSVAFSDVVIDALMVERGTLLGITDKLQSVQWGAMYFASLFTGAIGGMLAQEKLQQFGFLFCVVLFAFGLFLNYGWLSEQKASVKVEANRPSLKSCLQSSSLGWVLLFVGLWSFNPFSASVLYMHATKHLGFSETFYGSTITMLSIGCLIGSFVYVPIHRSVGAKTGLHLCIVTGILANLLYVGLQSQAQALWLSFFVGIVYMVGSLFLYDLCAKVSAGAYPGTLFALIMGLSNLSQTLATILGGYIYDTALVSMSAQESFSILVVIAAAITALCWFIFPKVSKI